MSNLSQDDDDQRFKVTLPERNLRMETRRLQVSMPV